MDLASLLNSPQTFEHDDVTYHLRQPNILECGEFQRGLEQEARASAARATELPEEDRQKLLLGVQREIVAGVYAWGGEVCVQSLRTPQGIAKLLAIVAREQGMTPKLALEIVDRRMREIAAILIAASAGDDPEQKKSLAAVCLSLGLPPDFLNTSSPESATPRSEAPPTSNPPAG
jgi:hypothetical protein